jgi:hypothetical protein
MNLSQLSTALLLLLLLSPPLLLFLFRADADVARFGAADVAFFLRLVALPLLLLDEEPFATRSSFTKSKALFGSDVEVVEEGVLVFPFVPRADAPRGALLPRDDDDFPPFTGLAVAAAALLDILSSIVSLKSRRVTRRERTLMHGAKAAGLSISADRSLCLAYSREAISGILLARAAGMSAADVPCALLLPPLEAEDEGRLVRSREEEEEAAPFRAGAILREEEEEALVTRALLKMEQR